MGVILVTGGAGYIGSHIVKKLSQKHDLVVYDNLSTGHVWAVPPGRLITGDILDEHALEDVFNSYSIDAVIHLAAFIQVPESLLDPLKYYHNNVRGTIALLKKMHQHGVKKFVFSSTAAVYGIPQQLPITEEASLNPINPYGWSKAMLEQILADMARAGQIEYVALRYFNVAGADPDGSLGEGKPNPSHLIAQCLKAAAGLKSALSVFGTDYPTPDGTCIRDYIHVDDLAEAHSLALANLLTNGGSQVFNCGYNHGYSVLEVLQTVQKVTGIDFPVQYQPRRPGDPPIIIADSSKIRQMLGWQPHFAHLPTIIQHAWNWEQKYRQGAELTYGTY